MKLFEITRGEAVLRFADYIARIANISPKNAALYQQVATRLFKEDFILDDNVTLYKLPKEGGVWEFRFPRFDDAGKIKAGTIFVNHYDDYTKTVGKLAIGHFSENVTVRQILENTHIKDFFNYVRSAVTYSAT